MQQTIDAVTGVWNATLSALVGSLKPQSYRRTVALMTIAAPARATLAVYKGYSPSLAGRVVNLSNADGRTYTNDGGGSPIIVHPGEALTFVWSGGTTDATGAASASITSEVS